MVILEVSKSSSIRLTEVVCRTGVLQAGAPSPAPVGGRAVTPTGIKEKVVGLVPQSWRSRGSSAPRNARRPVGPSPPPASSGSRLESYARMTMEYPVSDKPKGFANPQLLITTEALSQRLAAGSEPRVLLDLRPAEMFAAGPIPGAVHLDLFGVSLIDTDPGPKPVACSL